MMGAIQHERPSPSERPGLRRRVRLTILVSLSAVALIGAGPPGSGLEQFGKKLADEELGEMRGKFVQPSGVHFFGIEILQSWLGADGVTVQATLQFNVDFARSAQDLQGATPRLQVGWSRTCDSCGDPTMDIAGLDIPGDGLTLTAAADALPIGNFATVRGLAQGQQIAGSDNDVRNAMTIRVVPSSSTSSASGNSLAEVDTSASHYFVDGEAIHFTASDNELGITMTRGNESVRQIVSGPLNQAVQEVVLQSNFNAVKNEMGITVGIDELGQLNVPNVSSALSAMKGRGM